MLYSIRSGVKLIRSLILRMQQRESQGTCIFKLDGNILLLFVGYLLKFSSTEQYKKIRMFLFELLVQRYFHKKSLDFEFQTVKINLYSL